jgi:hypothetical protein
LSPDTQRDSVGFCAECSRLLGQYRKGVMALAEAGKGVSKCATSYEADAFNKAWEASQAAWHECSRLRHLLNEHMAQHGS